MKQRALWLAAFLLIGFFLYRKWDVVISIAAVMIYTAMFALLLAPACARMELHGVQRSRAAAYAVIGLFLMVVLLFAAFMPYLAVKAAHLFKRISPVAMDIAREWATWAERFVGTKAFLAESGGLISTTLSNAAAKMIRTGMTAAAQIGRIGFSLILTYYVLCDRKKLGQHLLLLVPLPWRREILVMLLACRNAMMSYFSGMLKTSAFVAAATCLGLLALGVQDALLLALLMGILEVIPYIGPLLASIPILLSAFVQGGETALLVLVMLVLVQQIEGSFITPYFTASSTSIHPLAAVFSVFVAGSLMGVWGILFAIPMLVLLQSVLASMHKMRHTMKASIWIY